MRQKTWFGPRARRVVALVALSVLTFSMASVTRAEARAGADPQIIGGDPADPGEYPFMAAILNENRAGTDFDKQYCGGSLIARTWVLTAAHCVDGAPASQLAVAVGRTLLDSDQGARRAVAAVFVHPDFGTPIGLSHDVALLQLAQGVSVAPIDLADAADDIFETAGTPLTVIGWGNVNANGRPSYPNELREVVVPAVSDADCARVYGQSLDPATMLCAGAPGIDSCQGDSGGPLFAIAGDGARIQMGVVSWGKGCAKKRFPGVYSEVNNSAIRAWISQVSGV
jgi:secreted trypsin-like serine protease